MIVEPVPTDSPSRRRRALARLALAVPVVLLVGVAGVGFLARTPDADAPGLAVLATPGADPTSAAASPPAEASAQPPATIPSVLRPRRPPFPVAIDGLVVQSVPQALAGPALSGRGEVVAIAGYFGMPFEPAACGDGLDPLGPLCERTTLLAEVAVVLRQRAVRRVRPAHPCAGPRRGAAPGRGGPDDEVRARQLAVRGARRPVRGVPR